MAISPSDGASFRQAGPAVPIGPVVLAVPHAGRDYPAELLDAATLPLAELERLEDRLADALVADALAQGATALIATRARAWIDLNRDEREVDPATVDPPLAASRLLATPKVRAGLGLVPRRIGGRDILRHPISPAALDRRIAEHRAYHAAIGTALAAAHARFGAALLLDVHSMPPLPMHDRHAAAEVVIGDRYGRSAAATLVDLLAATLEGAGLRVARNAPYAGGHTLDRHGRPAHGIHAIQLEFDRRLYLDAALHTPSAGLAAMRTLLARAVATLAAAIALPLADAAE